MYVNRRNTVRSMVPVRTYEKGFLALVVLTLRGDSAQVASLPSLSFCAPRGSSLCIGGDMVRDTFLIFGQDEVPIYVGQGVSCTTANSALKKSIIVLRMFDEKSSPNVLIPGLLMGHDFL